MMYVRGHPGDFDSWAAGGATGWSYADVLPYFRKSEGLTPSATSWSMPRRTVPTVLWAFRSATPCCRRPAIS